MSTTLNSYSAQPRTALGTTAATKLRAAGLVPVTISKRGQPSRHLAIDVKQANHLNSHVVHICEVKVGDETITALKGAVAIDCLKDNIQHIDLQAVDAHSEIVVDVAIIPDARECPGVKTGGIVEQRLRKIKVAVKADSIPDSLPLDLSKLNMGENIQAAQVPLPKGLRLVTAPKTLVLSVVIPRAIKVEEEKPAEAAAAAAAPAAGDAAKAGDAKAGDAKADAKAGDAKKK
jgi:large subunit ribosomal protein L25